MRWSALVVAFLLSGSAARAQSGFQGPPPLEALPDILQLSYDQDGAWRAYRDSVAEARADETGEAQQVEQINGLATPARLDALKARQSRADLDFDHQATATRAFYAALNPDQRKVFDQLTELPVPRRPSRPAPARHSTLQFPTDGSGQPLLPPPR